MYIIDALISLWNLKWTKQPPNIRPLPSHITRKYVSTPEGNLELLVCLPSTPGSTTSPPIFFAHGGCGSAGVWLEWINYLYSHGYPGPIYASSLRNHGASYTLPYRAMVHGVTFTGLQHDILACLEAIDDPRPPIIVGHSSGGGLAQTLLANGTKASGLCLVGAITSFGSYDLYWNWMKNDPWFFVRSIFHGQHPNSPLSSDELVRRAFFGHKFPMSQVGAFRKHIPAFEAMAWPMGMTGSFAAWWRGMPTWLDCKDIVGGIEKGTSDQVCVIVGKEDMMYRPWMWEKQCELYRKALNRKEGKTLEKQDGVVSEKSEGGVRLLLVGDSGHHVQNDVYHDEAAEAFMRWAQQV